MNFSLKGKQQNYEHLTFFPGPQKLSRSLSDTHVSGYFWQYSQHNQRQGNLKVLLYSKLRLPCYDYGIEVQMRARGSGVLVSAHTSSLMRANCPYFFLSFHSLIPCWQFAVGHCGSIYTWKVGKWSKSGFVVNVVVLFPQKAKC